jgi:23S rRNA pseudouridine2605 synthase
VKPPKRFSSSQSKNSGKGAGLARALSKLGFCSRSQAFALIREGKVRVEGTISRNPEAAVQIGISRIEVEGQKISAAAKIYLILNKPRGSVTTAADEKGRDTVYSLLPTGMEWIAPVGRLDKASEGLLLLTNDSKWAAQITDPCAHLTKTYHVQISAIASDEMLQKLRHGIETEKGEVLRAKNAAVVRLSKKNCWVQIVLEEGKNRHIRRMFEGLGVGVLRLVRVAIGPLQLGDLAKGTHRPLRPDEKLLLDQAIRKASV